MTDKPTYFLVPAVATEKMLGQACGYTDFLLPKEIGNTPKHHLNEMRIAYNAALAARPASYIALEAAWEELRGALEPFAEAANSEWAAPLTNVDGTFHTMVDHFNFSTRDLQSAKDALTALSEAEAAVKKEIG